MNGAPSPAPKAGADTRLDKVLLLAVLALVGIGIVMVYSSSALLAVTRKADAAYFLRRQLLASGIGLGVMLTVLMVGYRRFAALALPGLVITIILLILVLIPGIGVEVGGARRWIRLPVVSLQPAELAKIALVVYLAFSLAKKREKVRIFSVGFLPHCLVTGLLAVLTMAEPDFGTTVILAALLFVMLFAAGTRTSFLAATMLAAVPIAYHLVITSPYRMKRMLAFRDPWADPKGVGYQITESLMSIGSGGLSGQGLGEGRQKLFFLPEAHTDFIFSIIGEEMGFLGVLVLLVLFGIVVWRGFRASLNATEAFGAYLALGLTVLLGAQALINMGMAMGLLPTKGLALPFVSYGGSSLIVSMFAAGLLLSIGQSRGGFLRQQKGGGR